MLRSIILKPRIAVRNLSVSRLQVSEEVQDAVRYNRPVVSLESTIITHGLPYPENVKMAQRVEAVVRSNGAVPATVAFINGVPKVGLEPSDIEQLAAPSQQRVKISRRDIPLVMALSQTGGTTIAATMILSKLAGVSVFATGGLGGVHRHGEVTMDISADLDELSKTPVAVVCSGPKSILDVQRTMEYLETKGVPVMTYNDGHFDGPINVPGFYTRDSGVPSPYTVNSFSDAARIIESGHSLELQNGYLFCVPPPPEVALPTDYINQIIHEAQKAAEAANVSGKAVTPFMLKYINETTDGRSVDCNVSFVLHNASVASKIAKELSILKGGTTKHIPITEQTPSEAPQKTPIEPVPEVTEVDCVVVGSVALDNIAKTCSHSPESGDSNPGKITQSTGGVGFNISLAAKGSGGSVALISAVGTDLAGEQILRVLAKNGIPTSGIHVDDASSSAQYTAIHNESGDLLIACADMDITEKMPIEHVEAKLEQLKPKYVLFDSNISSETMTSVLQNSKKLHYRTLYDPTSVVKAKRLSKVKLDCYPHNQLYLMAPTLAELHTLYKSFTDSDKFSDFDHWFPVIDALGLDSKIRMHLDILSQRDVLVDSYLSRGVFQQAFNLLPYCPNIVLKDGANGIVVIQLSSDIERDSRLVDKANYSTATPSSSTFVALSEGKHGLGVIVQHFPALPIEDIKNVTGAGDSLAGYLLSKLGSSSGDVLDFGNPKREELFLGALKAAASALVYEGAINMEGLGDI